MYGQIIITEVFLKNKFRTIRPFAEVGGNAGGEKFIYNGILFKFAVDWKGIYGSDHAAMKVWHLTLWLLYEPYFKFISRV
jgi:hypothetical protein